MKKAIAVLIIIVMVFWAASLANALETSATIPVDERFELI